jgi:hypothetical protein
MVHHGDAVRQYQGFRLVVRDVHEGRAEGCLQLLELDLHVFAQLQIKGSQRFIEQQQCRLEHQAAGDRHALALSARELFDALVRGAGKPDTLEYRRGTARALGARNTAARQSEGDVLAN